MFTAEQIGSLKKGTLSKDPEKSKARISEEYKALSSKQKSELAELSTMSKNVLYNSATKGTASPKIVLSLAQIADVSPYYLVGMTDEKESFSEKLVSNFLKEFEIALEIAEPTKAKRKNRKEKADEISKQTTPTIAEEKIDTLVIESDTITEPETEKTVATIDEPKAEPIKEQTINSDEITFNLSFNNSQKMKNAVKNLDEESAVILLKALLKRAQTGGQAEKYWDVVKRCLLA